MPKDATKNVDRYKIKGGQLNEFDFQKNQEEFAEASKPEGNLIPGTPPEQREGALPFLGKLIKKAGKRVGQQKAPRPPLERHQKRAPKLLRPRKHQRPAPESCSQKEHQNHQGRKSIQDDEVNATRCHGPRSSRRGKLPKSNLRSLQKLGLLLLVLITAQTSLAQSNSALPKKLPSAEKIIDNYLKAIGGKKAAAALKDATYEWIVQLNEQPIGTARTQRRAPVVRTSGMTFGNGKVISGTNARSAWEIGLDNHLRTLSGLESAAAKLRATLDSSRLVNFKKANVLARVISLGDLASEPAYIVEFSTRSGARFQYYFSVKTSLITKITSDAKKMRVLFADYKSNKGILEPHRVKLNLEGSGELTLLLQSVKYDTGIEDRALIHPAQLRVSMSGRCCVTLNRTRRKSRNAFPNMLSDRLKPIASSTIKEYSRSRQSRSTRFIRCRIVKQSRS